MLRIACTKVESVAKISCVKSCFRLMRMLCLADLKVRVGRIENRDMGWFTIRKIEEFLFEVR